MACRLVGAKPLPEPVVSVYELEAKEQYSGIGLINI